MQLPRTSWHSEHLFDADAFNAPLELTPIDRIAIPQKILRNRFPRKCFNDLLSSPLGGGMHCDIEVHYPVTMMGEDNQHEQHLEWHSWNHE
jgi:hypothetical protein